MLLDTLSVLHVKGDIHNSKVNTYCREDTARRRYAFTSISMFLFLVYYFPKCLKNVKFKNNVLSSYKYHLDFSKQQMGRYGVCTWHLSTNQNDAIFAERYSTHRDSGLNFLFSLWVFPVYSLNQIGFLYHINLEMF